MSFDHGRETVEIIDQIKRGLADRSAEESLDVLIARPYRSAKTRKGRVGFYGDAAPTPDIKRERGVVVNEMYGADADVESGTSAAEATHERQVLEAPSKLEGGHGDACRP